MFWLCNFVWSSPSAWTSSHGPSIPGLQSVEAHMRVTVILVVLVLPSGGGLWGCCGNKTMTPYRFNQYMKQMPRTILLTCAGLRGSWCMAGDGGAARSWRGRADASSKGWLETSRGIGIMRKCWFSENLETQLVGHRINKERTDEMVGLLITWLYFYTRLTVFMANLLATSMVIHGK